MFIVEARSPGRRMLDMLVGLVLILLLGWLVIRNLLVNIPFGIERHLLEQVVPGSPALSLRSGIGEAGNQQIDPSRVRSAVKFSPLSGRPLSIVAAAASVDGNHGRALNLLINARNLDPRNAIVRLQLVGEYFLANKLDRAIAEADAAMRLQPAYIAQLAPLLPAMASTPLAVRALRAAVSRQPLWSRALLRNRALYEKSPALLFAIIDANSSEDVTGEQQSRQSAYLRRLVRQGEIDTAYLAFVNLLPRGSNPARSLVYDGGFAGMPGPPPFNWDLMRGQVDYARIMDGDGDAGLSVKFFSDRAITLASQIVQLPPGRYRLSSLAVADENATVSLSQWSLRCQSSEKRSDRLATLELGELGTEPSQLAIEFDVPENTCQAQSLSLRSAGSAMPEDTSFTVKSVAIERLS